MKWSPKDWTRPRSRAHREERAPPVSLNEILKDKYQDGRRRPEWAETAYKFGWMTMGDYYAVEPSVEGRNAIAELVYIVSPFSHLTWKLSNFAGPEAAQVP